MINKWLLISSGTGIHAIILIHFISCSSTLTSVASKDRRVHEVTREIFIYMYMYIKTDMDVKLAVLAVLQ